MLRPFLLLATTVSLHAALSVDIDLVKLRQAPEAAQIRQQLDALLPAAASARLKALDSLFGFDPRRDLTRVVIELPDAGGPTVRLVGLPAQRIASALALRGAGTALPDRRIGYALPRHPLVLFVAISDTEALIGRGDRLEQASIHPLPTAPVTAISAHLVPGAHPRAECMALMSACDLTSDGAGHIAVSVTAHDPAAAVELERRFGVMRDMVEVGAKGKLPRAMDAERLLGATTLTRAGTRLDVIASVPADLRHEAIARMVQRIGDRLGQRATDRGDGGRVGGAE